MSIDAFRSYINKKVELVQQILQDERAKELIAEKEWTMSELISRAMEDIFHRESIRNKYS